MNPYLGTITANPAVDLAVAPVESTRLDVNDNAAIRVTVRNDTALTATDVAVGFTLDAGLRANNADFPLGNCDVTDQQVDCSGGTLNANSSIELTLNFAGVSAGQHAIDITASAAETDPDSANNTATATITVQTAAPVSGSGGGGGGALFWAVLLLPLLARRRVTLE